MQKALAEDSTVYDYDGIYDDIQSQRLESKKLLGGADRKVAFRSPRTIIYLHGRQCSSMIPCIAMLTRHTRWFVTQNHLGSHSLKLLEKGWH